MEVIKNLLIRLRHAGALVLIGFFLIIYIALGFLWFQQGARQKELEEQIASINLILSKPLSGAEKLQAEYDDANSALASMSVEAALDIIVTIAGESGIDVDPDSGKLRIPPATVRQEKVGGGSYQVLSFKNISVQGDYDTVMAFISALDSGETLETMVLKRAAISQTETETTATLDVDLYTKPGGDSL